MVRCHSLDLPQERTLKRKNADSDVVRLVDRICGSAAKKP
jgi:hypothetical protein